jgi:hypothetical protein
MLAEYSKKYYISNTMLNFNISNAVYAVSLMASALFLRKILALRVAARVKALRLHSLR